MHEFFGDPIDNYSRAQALEDEVLCDISSAAREVGFKYPVAITSAAYEAFIEWTEDDDARFPSSGQSVSGRAHDVVWMLLMKIRSGGATSAVANFSVARVVHDGSTPEPMVGALKSVCGPGDDPEPVLTIMLPHED